jgi:hypothetical protein
LAVLILDGGSMHRLSCASLLACCVLACETAGGEDSQGSESTALGSDTSGESSTDTSGDGDGDGDGDDCLQASDRAGLSVGLELGSDDCEIVCEGGWGHPTTSLAIDWVLELDEADDSLDGVGLLPGPDELTLSVGWRAVQPVRIDAITQAGQVAWTLEPAFVEHIVQRAAIADDGTIYLSHFEYDLMTFVPVVTVTALTLDGQHLWTTQTSGLAAEDLVVTPDGVALLVSTFARAIPRELHFLTPDGVVAWTVPASVDAVIAAAPDGTIALADPEHIEIFDPNGASIAEEPITAIDELLGLQHVQDARFALVGSLGAADAPTSARNAAFGLHELGGIGWVSAYSDSRVWCDEVQTGVSDELFSDIVPLPDGTFVLAGIEHRLGTGWAPLPSKHALVARLDADAQLIAVDRGAWEGVPRTPIVGADGSMLVMINHASSPRSYQIRKYLP